jgi:hypothetical protein
VNACLLNFLIRKQPDVFLGYLLANFGDLTLVADDKAKMPSPIGRKTMHFKPREKLMLAEFEKGVTFAGVEFFQANDSVWCYEDRDAPSVAMPATSS